MRNTLGKYVYIVIAIVFILMILDAKTALDGASEGINMCIYSVVPSLFPFFFLSIILSSAKPVRSPLLHYLGRALGISEGAETYFLLGLLSGYPVGAKNINQAYKDGVLSQIEAKRMLGFCSNAGPSFIFGLLGPVLSSRIGTWALWAIHISAAIIVGCILPKNHTSIVKQPNCNKISAMKALEESIKSIAFVCGWVIVFRVAINIAHKWILRLLPSEIGVIICGLLELTNGSLSLVQIQNPGMRFIIACGLLSAGGVCIALQTLSVTKDVGLGAYFPGKFIQCITSIILACIVQSIIFPASQQCSHVLEISFASLLILAMLLIYIRRKK